MVGQCGGGSLGLLRSRGTILLEIKVNDGLWNCVMQVLTFPQHPEIKFPFSNTLGLSAPKLTLVFASVYE